MRKNFAVGLATLLFPLLVSGCDALGLGDDSESERLERSERLWSENEPARYRYVLERLCFCPQEIVSAVEISVEGGTVVGRRYVQSGQPVPAQWLSLFPAMEGVFEILDDAIRRPAGRLDITYDAHYGYPINAAIDYILDAIDDELSVRVTNFAPY